MKKISKLIPWVLTTIFFATPALADKLNQIDYSGQNVADLLVKAIQLILDFAGALAVLFIIYAGFLFITSNGNKDRVSQAKATLTYAVIGVIVISLSYAIVTFVGTSITSVSNTSSDSGGETVAAASVATPAKKAKAKAVSQAEADKQTATEQIAIEKTIVDTNNAPGQVTDTDTATASDTKTESETDQTTAYLNNFRDLLIKFTGATPAEASSDDIITGSVTFGSDGKYTMLNNSGASTYKQSDSRWGDKKYGKHLNKKGDNICSSFSIAGCAPSALSNALNKYISTNPEKIGNYIKDNYSSYRNNYTSSKPCTSGTKTSAIATVGSDFVTGSGYLVETDSVGWDTAATAVSNNYPVIFKTTSSTFTSGGHYLVIRGKIKRKKDGKIFYWLSDSGPKGIKGATKSVIQSGNGGYWKVYRTNNQAA